MKKILAASSFVCHKKTHLQCAGHMLISGTDNSFVGLAQRMNIDLQLEGHEVVFGKKEDCIAHHSR